ncbi:CRAL/TRIO domain-containing protein [Polychaeton citri CBS 116435]|uniref:CRAL/TRIO domain-containing protein n=1 Tax=Polychaeton citri CBS 116435 TaxID=1314669 RepID=A0A9P4USB9_9PEZI|nr:CRAL/TRIO domain-containing protein [Polychaeton citri CBS 116435]
MSANGADLKRIESYQYPAAHVGHLNTTQTEQLQAFKKLCEQHGYWKGASEQEPATHDDETLLRYLRARKFNPQDAYIQFKDTEDWRKENQLDQLYETIDLKEYEETRRLYPQWTGRRDKRGIPVYVFEVAHLDSKAVSAYQNSTSSKNQSITAKVPVKMLRLFALYENLVRFVLPLCSAVPNRPFSDTPISQSNNIVDISKVGLKQFWNLKNHMQDASQLATAHYPETLDRIFIIGAPSFFPTVWGWIKRWFDPITVSKIFILSSANMKATLEEYIDPENIPKKYGGKLDYKFGDLPMLEPAIANSLEWREKTEQNGYRTIPTGPVKWQYRESGELVAVAVGSEGGSPRNKVIAGLRTESSHPAIGALSPGRAVREKLFRTTTGNATHPPTPPASVVDRKPSAVEEHPNPSDDSEAHVPETSRAGTFTVPYMDPVEKVASPPADARQGTSSTRFEQQDGTHASGQLAEGTPEVKVDSQGEKQGVMEPSTVGQAPKEHPIQRMNDGDDEPQPSIIDQAKGYASQAVESAKTVPQTVLSAVGMGSQTIDQPQEQQGPPEDKRVDEMHGKQVEEFLRSKTMSQPQGETNFAKS